MMNSIIGAEDDLEAKPGDGYCVVDFASAKGIFVDVGLYGSVCDCYAEDSFLSTIKFLVKFIFFAEFLLISIIS